MLWWNSGHLGASGVLSLGRRPRPSISSSWVLACSSGWCGSQALVQYRIQLGQVDTGLETMSQAALELAGRMVL